MTVLRLAGTPPGAADGDRRAGRTRTPYLTREEKLVPLGRVGTARKPEYDRRLSWDAYWNLAAPPR